MTIDAETMMLGAQLRTVLRGGLLAEPDVRLGIVANRYADAEGNVVSYDVSVIGHDGTQVESVNIPGGSASYGIGQAVQLERVGGSALGYYRLAERIGPYGTETPALIGGTTTFTPTLITGLGFHIPKGDGCIIVGGTLVRDPNPRVTGTRVRICANGIKGLTDNGNGDRMAFMLATEDHTTFENDQPVSIGAGDAQLGYRDTGHLYVDSAGGSFAWRVGTQTLWQSQMVGDLPYTQMAGLLRLSDTYVGEGIEMGKDHRDAYIIQLLNKYGIPLILMRAGFDDDPNRAYMRIGPPPPHPNIEISSYPDGTPYIIMDGAALRPSSVTYNSLNILQISDISGNMGVLQAGRAEFLQPGTSFVHWLDFGDATGIVAGYDDQTQTGRLLGLDGGVIQTEINSTGRITWAAGLGVLEASGLKYYADSGNYMYLAHGDETAAFMSLNNNAKDQTLQITNFLADADAVALKVVAGITAGNHALTAESAGGVAAYLGISDVSDTYPVLDISRFSLDTDAPVLALLVRNAIGGTPTVGFGVRTKYQLQSSTTENQDAAAFDVAWSTATHASRTAYMRWLLVNNAGALAEYLRLTPSLFTVTPESMFRNHLTLDDDSGASPELKWVAEDGSTVRAWKENGGDFKFASNAGGIDFSGINGSFSIGGKNLSMGKDLTLNGGHDLHIYITATSGASGAITQTSTALRITTTSGDLILNPNGNVGVGNSGAVSGMKLAVHAGGTAALNLAGTSGTITSGIRFATDVDLYRSASDVLSTPDALHVGPANRIFEIRATPAVGVVKVLSADLHTLTGATTDDYSATIGINPAYTAASSQTLTRHNYINLPRPTLTNVTVTDACVFRFPAAAGTHEAIDAGTTKSSPGTVSAWMKININNTVYYIPAYTSKTS